MGDAPKRYVVSVTLSAGERAPSHPHHGEVRAGLDGKHRFWFVVPRPRFPLPAKPGECRYVEDFLDSYKETHVHEMAPLRADHKHLLASTRTGDKRPR